MNKVFSTFGKWAVTYPNTFGLVAGCIINSTTLIPLSYLAANYLGASDLAYYMPLAPSAYLLATRGMHNVRNYYPVAYRLYNAVTIGSAAPAVIFVGVTTGWFSAFAPPEPPRNANCPPYPHRSTNSSYSCSASRELILRPRV